ncbi:S41 family peptidase [Acidomonas methanolica]|uniref:Tricorn protease homolog n=1 Tax=Acidomonas methanolica NBRC 104435 TaxID=1231351 RepID=A0A023D129_ACIMT|nr:S41 family peptidase [Acidomonas methanolica]MBU2655354.1 PDZ domain-containing protein [Acidomonas methanolica]TCS23771.1 tricorn protease [Acidomonas methanolica]GAJ27858.1 tricorn protease [Acidomonas methanolica NBRC 104435]GBQ46569.1 Tricorn protease-like protein [Acidomonas methanolica]GEL00242.1 tricorn protease [Acidomonas methanolica NBRC 104435]
MSFRSLLAASAFLFSAPAFAAPGYLRTPSIASGVVAFADERSVWIVPETGGSARRLTTPGHVEPHPLLSPDGKQVAFLADFDGPTEIYVMPVTGGAPRRVTFEHRAGRTAPLPVLWDATAGLVFATTAHSSPGFSRMLARVDPATRERAVYPLADANDAALSPDGRWIYFVRFGTAISGDHLRDYRGGAVAQLWRFDLRDGKEAERIGPQDVNLRRPMLWRDRLIVISDRDGRDALWSYAPDGSDGRKLTSVPGFGIAEAALAGDTVVYRAGADLRRFDLAANADTPLTVDIASDDAARRVQWLDHPFRYLNDVTLGDDGATAALTFRGHVVLASPGQKRLVQIADAPDLRLRHAALAPDGKYLYAFSDASGESEIWRFPVDGSGTGTQLTHDAKSEPTGLLVSPDGKSIAHTDLLGRLFILDIASGADRLVEDATKDGTNVYDGLVWSPDSHALAFIRTRGSNIRRQIALYTLKDGAVHWATDGKYDSFSPAFAPDGHWLWFLSDRTFTLANDSPWGDRNLGPVFPRRTAIYALALQPGERFPFQPATELDSPEKKDDHKDGKKDAAPGSTPGAAIAALVPDGLAARLYKAPAPAGDYVALGASGAFLFALDGHDAAGTLKSIHIDRDEHKVETFAGDVTGFSLTTDGKTLLVQQKAPPDAAPKLFLVPAAEKMPGDTATAAIHLDRLRLRIDPGAEWREMFEDAWRLHRDHFFDQALRGVDWNAVKARYAPLVARLGNRSDLDDLLGQMMGELNALHSQLRPARTDGRPAADLIAGLGATLAREPGGYRILHIDAGEADRPDALPPLLRPGVNARNGDLIVAVNGQSVAGGVDLGDALADQAGRQVLLTLRRGGKDIRTVVTPLNAKAEAASGYTDWETSRAAMVDAASRGRIGYLHLRAMGPEDIETFAREFYADLDKDGLVIDVRRNMGGNIDSWVLTQLLRRPWMFWGRYGNTPAVNMQQSYRGHIVVLCDEFTYSDGETFSLGVKALKIAPLVGMRTAGAGVWLSDGDRLIDQGTARTAENPYFDLSGHWQVENHGVEPDVVVENMPHATFAGQDQQLSKAIDLLDAAIAAHPVTLLKPDVIPPLEAK